jgi:hypothetical protein
LKSYYRRGSANMLLCKYKDARADFLHVCKMRPTDRDARAKLTECDKQIKRIAFEAAIFVDEGPTPLERADPESIRTCLRIVHCVRAVCVEMRHGC